MNIDNSDLSLASDRMPWQANHDKMCPRCADHIVLCITVLGLTFKVQHSV
jgi:hypothetical protein